MATARLLAALAVARAAYVQPKGLVRRVGRDVVPNATNINAQQAKDVVTSGVDSQWVKHLGPTDSLEACARLCRAYDLGNGTYCRSFTRYGEHDPNAPTQCFGHVDRAWLPLADDNVDCGILKRPCVDDLDCSLNGMCGDDGACACEPGWTGDRCEALDLVPVDSSKLGFDPAENGANMSSWGGGVLEIEGAYHLFASELANHCGIGAYIRNSGVVRATSQDVEGPYERADDEWLIPPFAHEPVACRAPTGELVVVAVAGPLNASFPSCQCADGTTDPPCDCGDIPGNECHPQVPTLIWAEDAGGPWTSRPLFPDDTIGENPSVWIASTGEAFGMSRGGNMAAYAPDWRDASGWVHDVPGGSSGLPNGPDAEDPFLYQDADDNFHALLHNLEGPHMGADPMLVGVHAFSRDGRAWFFSGLAYTNVVEIQGRDPLVLNRRERPHLVFGEGDAARAPLALVTSAEAEGVGDRSFTLVQRVELGRR